MFVIKSFMIWTALNCIKVKKTSDYYKQFSHYLTATKLTIVK